MWISSATEATIQVHELNTNEKNTRGLSTRMAAPNLETQLQNILLHLAHTETVIQWMTHEFLTTKKPNCSQDINPLQTGKKNLIGRA